MTRLTAREATSRRRRRAEWVGMVQPRWERRENWPRSGHSRSLRTIYTTIEWKMKLQKILFWNIFLFHLPFFKHVIKKLLGGTKRCVLLINKFDYQNITSLSFLWVPRVSSSSFLKISVRTFTSFLEEVNCEQTEREGMCWVAWQWSVHYLGPCEETYQI